MIFEAIIRKIKEIEAAVKANFNQIMQEFSRLYESIDNYNNIQDEAIKGKVSKAGDTMSGILNMQKNFVTNVASISLNTPAQQYHAANREYVDQKEFKIITRTFRETVNFNGGNSKVAGNFTFVNIGEASPTLYDGTGIPSIPYIIGYSFSFVDVTKTGYGYTCNIESPVVTAIPAGDTPVEDMDRSFSIPIAIQLLDYKFDGELDVEVKLFIQSLRPYPTNA